MQRCAVISKILIKIGIGILRADCFVKNFEGRTEEQTTAEFLKDFKSHLASSVRIFWLLLYAV